LARLSRPNRHCDDHSFSTHLSGGHYCGCSSATCGKAVVNDHNVAATNFGRSAVVAAEPFDLMVQLRLGLSDGSVNCQRRNPKPANHLGVEQLDPTFGNGTNTQFGMLWRTNLAHD